MLNISLKKFKTLKKNYKYFMTKANWVPPTNSSLKIEPTYHECQQNMHVCVGMYVRLFYLKKFNRLSALRLLQRAWDQIYSGPFAVCPFPELPLSFLFNYPLVGKVKKKTQQKSSAKLGSQVTCTLKCYGGYTIYTLYITVIKTTINIY